MAHDLEEFQKRYAAMSDNELLGFRAEDLAEVPRQVYQDEIAKRGLSAEPPTNSDDDQPEWLDEAAQAAGFMSFPGNDAAPKVETACELLAAAGVPSFVLLEPITEGNLPKPAYNHFVMVPGEHALLALSVLDKGMFNADLEAEYRTHFETMTDEDLESLDTDALVAGLLDRVDRLENAYREEMERRGLTVAEKAE